MKKMNIKHIMKRGMSLAGTFTFLVSLFVLIASVIIVIIFSQIYQGAVELNAATSSEQAVTQVENMIQGYLRDMENVMDKIRSSMGEDEDERQEFLQRLVEIREDVVAVTIYDQKGNLLGYWSNGQVLKDNIVENLSFFEIGDEMNQLHISNPHVVTIFREYYPWVLTFSQIVEDVNGDRIQVALNIRFSTIANYVDNVGIGQRGYCYIADGYGNIIYHPQQQLINLGLKEETIVTREDGQWIDSGVIYTALTLEDHNWRIIGVSYVDEMITARVDAMVEVLIFVLIAVFLATFSAGWIIARQFTKPAKKLTKAMERFESETEDFTSEQIGGTREIVTLSKSFDHMVITIQDLMERIRREEIALRKTELKALQAQINPHFLYNTLDSIAWLCEDGRTQEAEEMVNALARLFRISISKGHELIPIEREIQHTESYLKIVNFRYKNQFTYSVQVDEECLPYFCNKITLQPIIENAIYHGINRMVDEGEIEISIESHGEDIVLSVSDNGVGMTQEKCEEILRHGATSGRKTGIGIGIKNVNDRIKIYFGEEYGITIESGLDEGTTVIIRIPKLTEEEYYEKHYHEKIGDL